MIVIATTTDFAHSSETADIGTDIYLIDFTWNTRDSSWYMTIYDTTGEIIVAGARIRLDWPFLFRFKDPRLPVGLVTAPDLDRTRAEPGRHDLGNRTPLMFVDRDEVQQIFNEEVAAGASPNDFLPFVTRLLAQNG